MNEPQGVASEILSLTLLANASSPHEEVQPNEFQHISIASGTLWPIVPSSSLFGYTVPENKCLLVTYLSVYTTAADESETGVHFGFNYDALAAWFYTKQTNSPIFKSQPVLAQALFNRPVLFVFDQSVEPRIQLTAAPGFTQLGASRRVEATANCYLLPSARYGLFQQLETVIG